MVRVLKVNVSGGFTNDIADSYLAEDLTGYTDNPVDNMVIVRNAPFNTLDEVKATFKASLVDVSADPEDPIQVTRRCRYYVNWSVIPAVQTDVLNNGWSDQDWTTVAPALMDSATDTAVF